MEESDILVHLKSLAPLDSSKPMISPNKPSTELKISMTKILMKLWRESAMLQDCHCEYLQSWVCSIGERRTTAIDTDRDTTDHVAASHQDTAPE